MSAGRSSRSLLKRQSEFDRRAIHMVGHVLMAGIWLERRLANSPKVLSGVMERPGAS
jgi:hypothetical protein